MNKLYFLAFLIFESLHPSVFASHQHEYRFFKIPKNLVEENSIEVSLNDIINNKSNHGINEDFYIIYNENGRCYGIYEYLVPYLFMELNSAQRKTSPKFLHVQTSEFFRVENINGQFTVTCETH